MAKTDVVRTLVEPIAAAVDADIYDVTFTSDKLQVAVTRASGISLDELAEISRQLSEVLDERDPISGAYTLEVSSPGLERNLRTPGHFAGAVDSDVSVRLRSNVSGSRRIHGRIVSAGDDDIVIDSTDTVDGEVAGHVTVALADIDKARTVFVWGDADEVEKADKPRPKPYVKKTPVKKAPAKKGAGKAAAKREAQSAASVDAPEQPHPSSKEAPS